MSVRIYQLSKELDMSNKELITLLQERGLDVSSPSNTIPNIYAESFRDEFKKRKNDSLAAPVEEKREVSPPPPPLSSFPSLKS